MKRNREATEETAGMLQWILPTIVLFIYIVFTLFTVQSSMRKSGRQVTEDALRAYTQTVVERINGKITEIGAVAETIAAGIGDESKVSLQDPGTAELYIGNISRLVEAGVVTGGYVIDARGNGIDQYGEKYDLSDVEWYKELADKESRINHVLTKAYPDGEGGYYFYVAAPIKGTKSWVALRVTTDFFRAIPALNQHDGKTQYLFMDSTGTVFSSVGQKVCEKGTKLFEGEVSIPQTEGTLEKLENNLYFGRSGSVLCRTGTGDKMMLYIPVRLNDWFVAELVTQSFLNNEIERYCRPMDHVMIRLIVAIGVFFMLIVIMGLINKAVNRKKRKDLQNKAETDLLTGLLNKISTEKHIQDYLENEGKQSEGMFFLLDIDNFKKINDTMGHAFGDEVLSTLGRDLSTEFRATDIVGRLGGDEFAVFLKNIRTDEIRQKEADRVLQFFRNFKAGEYVKYSATASIGVSVYPKDGKSFEELYKAADQAVYHSKKQGKNRLTFYKREFNAEEAENGKNN